MQVSRKVIQRREKVLRLLSRGLSQRDIATKLDVHETTVSRDIIELEEGSKTFIGDLARKTFGFVYLKSLTGIEQIISNAWEQWDKTKNSKYLSLLLDSYTRKIELLGDAPVIYENRVLSEQYEAKS